MYKAIVDNGENQGVGLLNGSIGFFMWCSVIRCFDLYLVVLSTNGFLTDFPENVLYYNIHQYHNIKLPWQRISSISLSSSSAVPKHLMSWSPDSVEPLRTRDLLKILFQVSVFVSPYYRCQKVKTQALHSLTRPVSSEGHHPKMKRVLVLLGNPPGSLYPEDTKCASSRLLLAPNNHFFCRLGVSCCTIMRYCHCNPFLTSLS